jgi:putative transposase
MARLTRETPIGVPKPAIQRGNNRQVCFGSDEDMVSYLHWLEEFTNKIDVAVHAWVLMKNLTYLLITPYQDGAVSKMMQPLGRMYVRYFNSTSSRAGTLWGGRYKSRLIILTRSS